MRELDAGELSSVGGGVAPLVVIAAVGAVVLGAAAIGVVAYAVSNDCTASAEVTKEGVKVEVDCKKDQ